jgi:hypothetical protein
MNFEFFGLVAMFFSLKKGAIKNCVSLPIPHPDAAYENFVSISYATQKESFIVLWV